MKTFVVRLFVPVEPAETDTTLRGLVEEIGADRSANFADGHELLAFLATAGSGHRGAPPERSLS
ncbi:MAG TPA: hypothetical protein VFM96_01885 [Gaiellaceae bacterium]|nr:hypothetical protein [Gaiellaceae bacterium]